MTTIQKRFDSNWILLIADALGFNYRCNYKLLNFEFWFNRCSYFILLLFDSLCPMGTILSQQLVLSWANNGFLWRLFRLWKQHPRGLVSPNRVLKKSFFASCPLWSWLSFCHPIFSARCWKLPLWRQTPQWPRARAGVLSCKMASPGCRHWKSEFSLVNPCNYICFTAIPVQMHLRAYILPLSRFPDRKIHRGRSLS